VRYSHSSPCLMDLDVVLVDRGTFEKMFRASRLYRIGDRKVRVPSMAHLIALKLHAMRNKPGRQKKDMRDILDLLEKNRNTVSAHELRALCGQYGPEDIEVKLGDFL
jgi:predicted nucleotidyltransferase